MFLGPDPVVRCMDLDPTPDPDTFLSSCKNSKKNLVSYYFVTLFDFLSLKNDENVPSKNNKQNIFLLNKFFVGFLKVNDKNSRIRIRIH
jgi:hypothetical protein